MAHKKASSIDSAIARLSEWVWRTNSLLIISGAGVSTASGIPDYRDRNGAWKRNEPMRFQEFTAAALARKRYWARSMVGWRNFVKARPNEAHWSLAALERQGRSHRLITQNVDGLHQAAGSQSVIDLHGRLDQVICLHCEQRVARSLFQENLLAENPRWGFGRAKIAPDGDADLLDVDYEGFRVPSCGHCGGIMKPDVVFFGENVPRQRVEKAQMWLHECDALLVVGSSLMVWSGFRFARAASEWGIPVVAINQGKTRADELLHMKVEGRCQMILPRLLR